MKEALSWLLKGAVMGAADAVPGVSGGTMALITGIYQRLVSALASLRVGHLSALMRGEWRSVWKQVDGAFLCTLGIGILVSLFSMLNLVHWFLAEAPQLLWSFFFGLIAASLVYLMRQQPWRKTDVLLMTLGTIIASGIAFSSSLNLSVTPLTLIMGGAFAISAMMLPGISGSFVLLLLGLYPAVVTAVHERDLVTVAWVALGCLIGLLAFSRLLNWLLVRGHDRVMGFMLGFILGAMVKVWPWQYQHQWLMPSTFERLSGEPALVFGCFLAASVGALTVVGLTWKGTIVNTVKS